MSENDFTKGKVGGKGVVKEAIFLSRLVYGNKNSDFLFVTPMRVPRNLHPAQCDVT
jgi:hypothetical protein